MLQIISGQKDPIIKLLRELQSEEARRHSNRYFVEEQEIVRRAFDFGGKVESLIITEKFAKTPEAAELIERAEMAGIYIYQSTEGLISKILDAKPTPECMAIIERVVYPIPEIFAENRPLVMMVESCENADNLGMLLRSTDAAGVTGVILAANTTDPFSRRVVRASRGAVFTMPIAIHPDSERIINEARENGLQIISTSANTDKNYTDIDFSKPTMIIVGNEHTGISDTVRELSDAVVRIPMQGKINLLNIAVAASVVMYEAVRQRLCLIA
jgi:TrmH family RNA methyltransferase